MKLSTIEEGTAVYFIESSRVITEARVIRRNGDFYTIGIGRGGAIRVRRSRLFLSKEDAQAHLPVRLKQQRTYRSPYEFGA